MTIKVTYNVTDVYMTQSVSPVYINVSYSGGGTSGGGVWGTITGTLSNQTDLQNALNAKVPYSGATGDVSLGEYGINVGNVIYDTTPTGIPTEQGATYWDADAETVALIMNGTIQKIGEDTFYHVRNTTGSTIPKGTAVRFSGTTGNSGRLLIAPMLANGTYPSQYYMGITSEELTNNQDGKVYHFGKMRNINTSAFADGDVLYVSPSVAGALTATAPVAPNNIIVAAAVVHAANNGTLMIRTTLGSNINSDEGVLITTPTANQGLFYDSGLWVNKSIATALGYTPANAATTLTINGVTYDLSANRSWTVSGGITGSGASGQVAYWTGTSAQSGSNYLFWDATNSRLGIGLNNPTSTLHVYRTATNTASAPMYFSGTSTSTALTSDYGVLTLENRSTSLNTYSGILFNGGVNQDGFAGIYGILGTNTSTTNWNGQLAFCTRNSGTYDARFRILSNGNTIIQNGGTFTDSGERLQVTGNVKVTGNTTIGGVLTISASVANYLYLGVVSIENITTSSVTNINANTRSFSIGTAISSGSYGTNVVNYNTYVGTSGAINHLNASVTFAPTSGNAVVNMITATPTINQTGGANGITRGLYINPNLTAAADFRAIETTNGKVIFGNLPTSSAGLPSGAIWNDAGTIKIV